MEFDLLFQDDSASFSSSQSLSNSEAADDLHLGAEANTIKSNSENAVANSTVDSFLILRRGHSLDEEDSLFTFSTISNISDLIDAREGDPEDLLFQLGFTQLETAKAHSSILSRFNTTLDSGTSSCSPDHRPHDIGCYAKDGIIKAQEWVNAHQNDIIGAHALAQLPNLSKESLQGYKVSASGTGRKIAAQKKRSKWSKSRQSSFEHLLPNLQEESAVEVQESEKDAGKEGAGIRPIRESSTEQEPQTPEAKDIIIALSDPSLRHLHPSKCASLQNMKVDSFELEEVISNDGCVAHDRTTGSSPPAATRRSAESPISRESHDWDACKPPSSIGSTDSSSGFDEGTDDVSKTSTRRSSSTRDACNHSDVGNNDSWEQLPDISQKGRSVSLGDPIEFNKVSSDCSAGETADDSLSHDWDSRIRSERESVCSVSSTSGSKSRNKETDEARRTDCLLATTSMQNLSRDGSLPTPKLSPHGFSDLNTNFNNSVDNPRSDERAPSLRHACSFYSSMPALSSAGCARSRSFDCVHIAAGQPKANSSSSLMTSIADVAYLSYKRLCSNNHGGSNSGRVAPRFNGNKTHYLPKGGVHPR